MSVCIRVRGRERWEERRGEVTEAHCTSCVVPLLTGDLMLRQVGRSVRINEYMKEEPGVKMKEIGIGSGR